VTWSLAAASAGSAPASHLTPGLELLLFVLAGLLTLTVVSVFIVAVMRNANRDGLGRTPDPTDDREAL